VGESEGGESIAMEGFFLDSGIFAAAGAFGTFGVGLAGFEAELDCFVLDAGVVGANASAEAFVCAIFPAGSEVVRP